MALELTLLGITGIGIIWILKLLKKECDGRNKERSLVKFLADEIQKLCRDVDDLKK
jgi:hypothetical protein